MTGAMESDRIPARTPFANSSSVNACPSKYFSISSSSVSATASESASRSESSMTDRPNFSLSASMTASTSTFSLSVLLMIKNRGMSNWLQEFQAFSVPTWMPEDASTKIAADSTALMAELTSPTKSKNPGVSIKLSFVLLKSLTVLPSSTRPSRLMTPFAKSAASRNVVFPLPPCPTSAMFLMFSLVYPFMLYASSYRSY